MRLDVLEYSLAGRAILQGLGLYQDLGMVSPQSSKGKADTPLHS
jgi:hypothetical protein